MVGELFILLSQLLWAFVLILQKKLDMDALVLSFAFNAIGTIVMLPMLFKDLSAIKGNINMIAIAAVFQTLGLVFYLGGLRIVTANITSLLFMTFPMFTSVLAMVFLGEKITAKIMVAFGLMAAGLLVLFI